VTFFQPTKTPRKEPQLHHKNTTTSPQKTINFRPLFPQPPQKHHKKSPSPPSTTRNKFSAKKAENNNNAAQPLILLRNMPSHTKLHRGRVAEWLMAPVLKTGVPERVSGVRIPPLPPYTLLSLTYGIAWYPNWRNQTTCSSIFRRSATTERCDFHSCVPLQLICRTVECWHTKGVTIFGLRLVSYSK
jgi:hypothetical protein